MIIQRKQGLEAVLVLTQGILITLMFVLCALVSFNFFTSVNLEPDRPVSDLCLCDHGGAFL